MRQAGILAAAALHAIEHHRPELEQDHRRARRLAEGLAKVEGVRCQLAEVETNIVVFDVDDAERVVAAAKHEGVLMGAIGKQRIRAVTHRDVDDAGIERALKVIASVASA